MSSERGQRREVEEIDNPRLEMLHEEVNLLNNTFSRRRFDREVTMEAAIIIRNLAMQEENMSTIVAGGAISALVRHLEAPPDGDDDNVPGRDHGVQLECARALGVIASWKAEYQQRIVHCGALPHLVDLLKIHKDAASTEDDYPVIRWAAYAIANLAYCNSSIRFRVRLAGGIPPLVELLWSENFKVQREAAGALHRLAFQDVDINNLIKEGNALPKLYELLSSNDTTMKYEAVGLIGHLVATFPDISREVLDQGTLQPVIDMLSSGGTNRLAAWLLSNLAIDPICKAAIIEIGAVGPLIETLQSPDEVLKELSVITLRILAQDSHNQADIADRGGLEPLFQLLSSKKGSVKHHAAIVLYLLSNNENHVSSFVRLGGVQKLVEEEFTTEETRLCVKEILIRLGNSIQGQVLNHLLDLMREGEEEVKRRVALAFAHLCSREDHKAIFIDYKGLDLLVDLLGSTDQKQEVNVAVALCKLASKTLPQTDSAPRSPKKKVYLGEEYVNNQNMSDVTFLIEGRQFYAHRICLHASSRVFRSMLDGGFHEEDRREIPIQQISWEVFKAMMSFLYTGSVHVPSDIAIDLLRAADQYLLTGLQSHCEHALVQVLSVENVTSMYEFSESVPATDILREGCIKYMMEHYDKLISGPEFLPLIRQIRPAIHSYYVKILDISG